MAVIMQFTPELNATGPTPPPPPPPEACDEYGRATRCYVSAYIRDRIHLTRLYASEKRCLVADLNGAIAPGRSIAKVTWQTNYPYTIAMSNAAIVGRAVQCLVEAQYPGRAWVRCTVDLDNGERYVQQYQLIIAPQPYYTGDTYVSGPTSITAIAES